MEESISVIIPAYNEETRILTTLIRLSDYLAENFKESEIIVVDDGSSDSTSDIVRDLDQRLQNIKLIRHQTNTGKGYAVKQGVLSSKHSLLLTCDADMSTPIEEVEKLIPYVTKEFISKKAAPSPLSSPSRGEDGSKSAPPLRGGDEGEGMKGRVILI